MKNKLNSLLAGTVVGSLLITGTAAAQSNAITAITEAEAKQIALAHAAVSEADAEFIRIRLDNDGEYDVEFHVGIKEYDYEIDSATGSIRSVDYDVENFGNLNSRSHPGNSFMHSSIPTNAISESEAKAIALKDAGVSESDVTILKLEPDYENGRWEYDIEFYTAESEYDYEIDAISGKIRSADTEIERYTISNNSVRISLEEAKRIALAHAGLSEFEVKFTKARLDYDDGIEQFDIDFIAGEFEYDYEIRASDGKILESDAESIYD